MHIECGPLSAHDRTEFAYIDGYHDTGELKDMEKSEPSCTATDDVDRRITGNEW